MVVGWWKWKEIRKVGRSINIKKNYKKIGKKNYNVDINVTQLEDNNNKYFILVFRYILNAKLYY